jgi:hypothetical protein
MSYSFIVIAVIVLGFIIYKSFGQKQQQSAAQNMIPQLKDQYKNELVAKQQELVNKMAEARRLKPTLELDSAGTPIQKGLSGDEMMDSAQEGGVTLEEINKSIVEVDVAINKLEAAEARHAALRGKKSKRVLKWLKEDSP